MKTASFACGHFPFLKWSELGIICPIFKENHVNICEHLCDLKIAISGILSYFQRKPYVNISHGFGL